MKIKKILGWIIIIVTIVGLVFVQALLLPGEISFLFALEVSIVLFLVEVAISTLIIFAIKWITD